jgi:S-formylglutathione hydrolase FrmB
MKKIKWLLSIGLLFLLYKAFSTVTSRWGDQVVSYEPATKECFSGGISAIWKYCVYTARQGTNGGIAYLLHGRNLDENIWNDDTFYTALIQKLWAMSKDLPPRIVTVSFGPIWLLTPKNSQKNSGLIDIFTKELIPEIEKKLGNPSYRVVFGESMGGLNSLILGLRTQKLFQKVAALCPAVYTGSPFDSFSKIKEFIARTGADPKIIYGVMSLAKKYVSNQEEWESISPTKLIETSDPNFAPEFYLSSALYDAYGNFEGSEYLADRARLRGFKINWRPLYGGHCAVDVTSLADFLLE